MISCASNALSLRPLAFVNVFTTNSNNSTNGPGPEARPPNVFNLVPAGLTLLTSQVGISPAYNDAISKRSPLAQPSLESFTLISGPELNNFSGISGSLDTYFDSTEKPTPVPQVKINKASSNYFGSSTGR